MLDWRTGLRFRLILTVLMALLPVFGLFAYFTAKSQQTAIELAHASLQSEALLAAAGQQLIIERVAQLLGDAASAPSIKDTRLRRCVVYLKNLKSQDTAYANLGVIGLDGTVTCHALDSGSNAEFFLGDRAFFKQVLKTQKFSIGDYGIGPVTGQPALGLGAPVYGDDGALNGVAFAALDLSALSKALSGTPLLGGASLRVLDRRNTLLAIHPSSQGASKVLGDAEQDHVVLAAVQDAQPGLHEGLDSHGVQQVYAYAPVGGTRGGLFVAISVPRDIITAGPLEAQLATLLALLCMSTIGAVAAWWLGGRLIILPAKAILKEAEEITQGNLSARVNPQAFKRGELGQIGASFNRMAESLQTRNAELEAALQHVDREKALRDLILDSMSEGVIAIDQEWRCVLFNHAAGKLFPTPEIGGVMEGWRHQQQLMSLDGTMVYPLADRPMTQALRGVSIDNWDVLLRSAGREDRILRISTRPMRDANNQLVGGVGVFNDITDLKNVENLIRGEQDVLALIASGASLTQSLNALVRLIQGRAPGSMCSVLMVKENRLYGAASVGLPTSFLEQIEGLPVGDGVGACGTAAFLRKPVIVENTATDPLMKNFRDVLAVHDLQACWSTPVLSADGQVLATFAVYHHHPCAPQARDNEMLGAAVRLARIALERANAETALINSQARFRELAENIEDVFYNRDTSTGQILYISPGYEKIWGRSCESLYADSESYLDAVLPEHEPMLLKARKRDRRDKTFDEEYRILNTNGDVRWIRDTSYPVFDAAGQLERIVGTARDITDRKLAEFALSSTNRAMQMISRSSMAISRADDEATLLAEICGVAVEVGDYRMAWVGYAVDDGLRSIKPVAHAGHEAGYLSSIKLSWSDEHPIGQGPAGQTIRSGLPHSSGDIALAENHFHWHEVALGLGYRSALFLPLRDGQRTFGLLGLYAGDVQNFPEEEVRLLQELADNLAFGIGSLRARLERRRSQEAARDAAAKVREQASLLDRARDAIMVRNLDQTIRYWNKGAENLYGWSSDEVLGKTMVEVMYKTPQVLATAMQQTLASGGDWTSELEQVARDGSTVHVEAHWTVMRDDGGEINGVLGINTDLRERKRAREEILRLNASLEERVHQRTAQLEFANKQLEGFSYSLSHDLRTPLSAVDGFCHLLEVALTNSDADGSVGRHQHYLTRIRAGVVQMGELIDVMLSLAQVSRKTLRWEPVDLSALAESLLNRYQKQEPDRSTLIHIEPGLRVRGDPQLLRQVLDNLLGNAWKFCTGRPRTEITFGREKNALETVYFVRDNGAGFDMAYASKLFGTFERLHLPSEFAGTGIGLTTVQRIILRHGGRVWGQAAPGMGATFYFTLGSARL